MADLEDGLWACNETRKVFPNNTPQKGEFITGMVKGGAGNRWSIKGGNVTPAGPLSTLWDGPRPQGYFPMRKQGSIILGIGGDNSNSAVGVWFEGVMTAGFSSDAADNAVMASIVGAGFMSRGGAPSP